MYNRYKDISKFINDINQLCVADDGYVYISKEEDYDIAVDMEGCYASFDVVKPFIVLLTKHICELDNLVQRFNQKKRIKNGGQGCVSLPSPAGILRFDYSLSMEDDPVTQRKEFPFKLQIIYIENQNHIVFDYWSTINCTQFDVTFEYKENTFFLRKYGSFDCIPDNWEETASVLPGSYLY